MSRASLRPALQQHAHRAPRAAAADVPWYLAGGISAANCIAAYSAVGAASQAASYVNLANPGTYDLTAPVAAPTWDTATGWTFNGSTQFLDTGLTEGNGWSVVVSFAGGPTGGTSTMYGHRLASNNGVMLWSANAFNREYRYGNLLAVAGVARFGTMGIANTTAWRNGVQETGTPTGTHTDAGHTAYVGACNNNGVAAFFYTGQILALAVYDTNVAAAMPTLTATMPLWTQVSTDPGVYLTFDDNLEGVYDLAYPYLDALGIQATAYVITDRVGTAGYMTVAELQTLDADGWDIANHTKDHTSLSTLNLAAQTAEISDAKATLDGWGLTGASSHVGYPFGTSNADTLTAMANLSMITGRNITETGIITPATAPYAIPSYEFKTNDNLATLKAAIQGNMRANLSTMIYMHNVVEAGGTAFDILYSQFTPLVDWLVASGYPCRTITELPLA